MNKCIRPSNLLNANPRSTDKTMFKVGFSAVALLFMLAAAPRALATANYVYHERTTNNPGCGAGAYVDVLQPTSAQGVTVRFKVEYQFYTDNARIYYTTDGSNPAGGFGTASNAATSVVAASYDCTFTSGPNTVDVAGGVIPAQPAGTVVKYVISAWHSGGGTEIFANSGEFSSPFNFSSQATVFSYTVCDTPSITCPSAITTNTAAGLCSQVVSFTPSVSGLCNPAVVCNPASGSTFNKGTTTVNCGATNEAGLFSTCSFSVTVNDTENPVIGACPANITDVTDAGQCSKANVTWTDPSATDNCPGVGVACVPASGSAFNKGVTIVTCTATDSSGNTNACTFTVTINDTELPVLTFCPTDFSVTNSSVTGTTVSFTPTATDNCPGVQVVCTPASGSLFAPGTTPVSCIVTDAVGNAASSPCNFNVTVYVSPGITVQPVGTTICSNSPYTFTVTATGDPTLSYQWRQNGANVGTDSSSYAIASVQASDQGNYDVIVSNPYGSVTSVVAALIVRTNITISGPANLVKCPRESATFTVNVTGSGPYDYVWRFNGGAPIRTVTGATSPADSYTVASVALSDLGIYTVEVTGQCGDSQTNSATLGICASGAIAFDFDTVGQLTNNFGAKNAQTPANAAAFYEVRTNGVAGSGSLDGNGLSPDSTFTVLGSPYDFSRDGRSLNMSMMVKIKAPTANTRTLSFGFISMTNSSINTALNMSYMTVRLNTVAQPALTFQVEQQHKLTNVTGNITANVSGNLTLTAGNWYKLTASFTNAVKTLAESFNMNYALQDMGVNGTTPGAILISSNIVGITNIDAVTCTTYYPCFRGFDNAGADAYDNLYVWTSDGAPVVTVPPADQTVTAFRPVTLTAKVDGTLPFSFQWYTNGVAVPGGTNASLTFPALAAGITAKLAVTNSAGGTESATGTITVNADGDAPTLVSAGSVDGSVIGVAFSEAVDSATALNTNNYSVSVGGPVIGATMRPDGQTVALALVTPAANSFIVTVSGVTDLAGNSITPASTAGGTVMGLSTMHIGRPMTQGSAFSSNSGDVDFSNVGGNDIWNNGDQGLMATAWRTGDFDVVVRIADMGRARVFSTNASGRDDAMKFGLIVRETMDPTARMVTITANPPDYSAPAGLNILQMAQRTSTGAAAAAIGGNTNLPSGGSFPNVWLRLRRAGSVFTGYYATNANPVSPTPWHQFGQTTLVMSNAVQLGLVGCAHWDDINYGASAQFRGYGPAPQYSGASIVLTADLPTTTNVVLASPVGQIQAFGVGATVSVAPARELQYTWQRGDGMGGFTNIPSAGAGTPFLPTLGLADNGAQFRAILRVPGVTVTSTVCTVTVTDPTVASVSALYYGRTNFLVVDFNQPLGLPSATNGANYLVTNAAGTVFTVTNAVLIPEFINNVGFSRVVLYTLQHLVIGDRYFVTANSLLNASNVSVPSGTASTLVPSFFNTPVMVELFTNLPSGMNQAGFMVTPQFGLSRPDVVLYTNRFDYRGLLPNSGIAPNISDYGARVSAYFVPPTNGSYRIFMRADDSATLYMNTNHTGDSTVPSGKVQLCNLTGFRHYYSNDLNTAMSTNLTLVAGRKYYIEAILKEGGGDDGVGIVITNAAFTGAMGIVDRYTLGSFFQPLTGDVVSCSQAFTPTNAVIEGASITSLSVSNITGAPPYGIQWKKNGVPISGANSNMYTTPPLYSADNGAVFSVVVNNPFSTVERVLAPIVVWKDLTPPFVLSAVGNVTLTNVIIVFNELMTNTTANIAANYQVPGVTVLGAAMRTDSRTVVLTTTPQTPGQTYAVVINNVLDRAVPGNPVLPNTTAYFTAWKPTLGILPVEIYNNVTGGNEVWRLGVFPNFLANLPDSVQFSSVFGWNNAIPFGTFGTFADNYGARIAAWFNPPSNGVYRFYIRSDDYSELWMNTNSVNSADPAGKVIIAAQYNGSNPNFGDRNFGPVVSPEIPLTGGQLYFMEALMKDNTGNDGFNMVFREQGDPTVPQINEITPAYFFVGNGNPDVITNMFISTQPENGAIPLGQGYNLSVGVTLAAPAGTLVSAVWQIGDGGMNWTNLLISNAVNNVSVYRVAPPAVGDYYYRAVVAVPGRVLTSAVAQVTVTDPTDQANAPTLAGVSANTNKLTVAAFFSEPVTPASAQNTANYTLVDNFGANYPISSAVLLPGGREARLTLSSPLTPGNYTNYTLTASSIEDFDAPPKTGGGAYNFYAPDGRFIAEALIPYTIGAVPNPYPTHQSVSNNYVVSNSVLFGTGNLNGAVDASNPYLPGNFDNYVFRLAGYIIPASNATYRIWASSDDQSMFLMNTNPVNASSPTNTVIYQQPGAFNAFSSFTPTIVYLRAGQRYYWEARVREGGGGECFALKMQDVNDPSLVLGPNRAAPTAAGGNASNQVPGLVLSLPERLAVYGLSNMTVASGTTLRLAPTVIGQSVSYYWYTNNVLVTDAVPTNSSITLANINVNNTVSLIVSNILGPVTNTVIISVPGASTPPAIFAQLGDLTAASTNAAALSFGAAGTGPLSYYWYSNGILSAITSSSVLPLNNQQPGTSASFYVVVSNAFGTVTSAIAQFAAPANVARSLDFNTPNQLTNNFAVRNRANGVAVWYEITNNGVGGSGALDAPAGAINANYNTLTWFADAVPFPTNDGARLNMSVMYRGKQNTNAASRLANVMLGFVGYSNDVRIATNSYMEGNGAVNWVNFRTYVTNTSGIGFEYGTYMTGDRGATFNYRNAYSPPIAVQNATFTNWYRLSASFMRTNMTNVTFWGELASFGPNGTAFESNVMTLPPTVITHFGPFNTLVYPALQAREDTGVNFIDNWGFSVNTGAVVVTVPPQDLTVDANRSATFRVVVDGTPSFGYQWYTNGAAVPGSNAPELVLNNVPAGMSGIPVYVTVTNQPNPTNPAVVTVNSATATLTVLADGTAPTVVSAGSMSGFDVGVVFNEQLDPVTALNTNNYAVTGGTVIGATLRPDGKSVQLRLGAPTSGNFTVTVTGVKDLAGNTIGGSNTGSGTVLGLTPLDIGAPAQIGTSFSGSTGDIDTLAGGSDIWNAADQGHFALGWKGGDFDVRVRVQDLNRQVMMSTNSGRDEIAKAHLVARADWSAGSPWVGVTIWPREGGMPGAATNKIQMLNRTAYLAGAGQVGTDVVNSNFAYGSLFPNAWLRLRRVNNTFTTFYATNASPTMTDWFQVNQTTLAVMPSNMLVGLASVAHFDWFGYKAAFEYRGFSDVTAGNLNIGSVALSIVTNLPSSVTIPLNSASNSLLQTVTLTVTPAVIGVLPQEVQYLWQRWDGASSFTNLPYANAGSGSFTTPVLSMADNGAQFRVIVTAPGATPVTSGTTTLTITDTAAPTAWTVQGYYPGSNFLSLTFAEPMNPASAANTANYSIVNSLGEPVSVVNALYLPPPLVAAQTPTNVYRVVLETGVPLTNNTVYLVTVSGVMDANGQTLASRTLAAGLPATYGPLMVEFWYNILTGSSIADVTGNPRYIAGAPDYIAYSPIFGYNRIVNSDSGLNLYGGRISGYFVPPTNGSYRFYIKCDDNGVLYMNTNVLNSTDPFGKTQIALMAANSPQYLNTVGGSMSTNITLFAGQRYYIEGNWREGTGGDGFAMFVTNGATAIAYGFGDYFAPGSLFERPTGPIQFTGPIAVTPSTTVAENGRITFTPFTPGISGALPYVLQWRKNGETIPGGTNVNYTTPPLTAADNGAVFTLRLHNQFSMVETSITVSVVADATAPSVVNVSGRGDLDCVVVNFSEVVTTNSATNILNYAIPGLTIYSAFLSTNGTNLTLKTSPHTPDATYTINISGVQDASIAANTMAPTSMTFRAWNYSRGFITAEFYMNLNQSGTLLQYLTTEPKWINDAPDVVYTTNFFAHNGVAASDTTFNYYAARFYAWFVPPSNGLYRFYIRSDDSSILLMNTNGADPAGKAFIAGMQNTCCGNYGDFSRGTAISPEISLTAGQRYYMEAQFREGGGNDYFNVAMRERGDQSTPANTEFIPPPFFVGFANPSYISSFAWLTQPVGNTNNGVGSTWTMTAGAFVLPTTNINYQWQVRDSVMGWLDLPLPFSTNTFISVRSTVPATNDYRVLASIPGMMITSAVATVVWPQDDPWPPTLLGASCSTNQFTIMAQFDEWVTTASANDPASYVLTNEAGVVIGISNAVLQPDNLTVLLTTSNALSSSPTNSYTLVPFGVVDRALTPKNCANVWTFWVPDGRLRYDMYAGGVATPLPVPFPNGAPTLGVGAIPNTGFLTNQFEWEATLYGVPMNASYTNNYNLRVAGYFVPITNGYYKFYVRGDDDVQLWMNTNLVDGANPAGVSLICQSVGANNCCKPYTDTVSAGGPRQSAYIPLLAGQRYYWHGYLGQGAGLQYLFVDVRELGDTRPLVDGFVNGTWAPATTFLSPGLSVPTMGNVTFAEGTPSATITPTILGAAIYNYRWYTNNVEDPSAVGTTYTFPFPLPIHYSNLLVGLIVSNNLGVASNAAYLVVTNEVTLPYLVSVNPDGSPTDLILTFSELVGTNALDTNNYSISGLSVLGAFIMPGGSNVLLTTTPQTPGSSYTITVSNVQDIASTPNTMVTTNVNYTSWAYSPGFLVADYYTGITGGNVMVQLTNFMNIVNYSNRAPTFRTTLGSFDWRITNFPMIGTANYGVKVWGWFTPPADGQYNFYMRSDDASRLYMNTGGASPYSKTLIAQEDACCHAYNYVNGAPVWATFTTNINMVGGQPHYIEALMINATGQEYLQVAFTAAGAPVPIAPPDSGWVSGAYWAGAEVIGGAYLGSFGSPTSASNVNFVLQPIASTNIAAGASVTLKVMATNDPGNPFTTNAPIFYQWQTSADGVTWNNVADTNNFRADYMMMGNRSNYTARFFYTTYLQAIATLPGGITATSSVSTVTVDDADLHVVSIGSLDGRTIRVTFNRPVDPGYATDTANFLLNYGGIALLSAATMVDERTVLHVPEYPLSPAGNAYLLSIGAYASGYLPDITGSFACDQEVEFEVVGATYVNDIGVNPGVTDPTIAAITDGWSTTSNSVDVIAAGSDILNLGDGMFYVGREVLGNFDIRTRVAALTNDYHGVPSIYAKAGLVARVSTNYNSRMIGQVVSPPALLGWPVAANGTNAWNFIYRDVSGGSAAQAWTPSPFTPWGSGNVVNPWVRLVRSGNTLYSYISTNGNTWFLGGSRDTSLNGGAYPASIWVGMGVSSANNASNILSGHAKAQFRNLYFQQPPVNPLVVDPPAITTNLHASSVVFTATGTPDPGSGPIWYQWLKNGAVIPGATNTTLLVTTNATVANNGNYSIVYGYDGGGLASAPGVLEVTNSVPIVVGEYYSATQNVVMTFPTSQLLANDSDPELEPLSIIDLRGLPASGVFYSAFELGLLPTGTATGGVARVDTVGGYNNTGSLKINDALGSQSGWFVVSNLTPGRPVLGIEASFKLRIAGGSANPADGFSFSFATNAVASLNGAGYEEGTVNGLSICFDNYDSGGGEAPAIDVKWDNVVVGSVKVPKISSPDYQDVQLTLRADGKLTLRFGGTNVYTDLQTPYTAREGDFVLAGRSGGQIESHWVDDLSITAHVNLTVAGGVISLTNNVVTYIPPANGCGWDYFQYLVSDGQVNGTNWARVDLFIWELVNEPPYIVAGPTNVTLSANTNCQLVLPDMGLTANSGLIVTDNCSIVITQSPLPGTPLPLGNTVVTLTIVDGMTNTVVTNLTVSVVDSLLPVFAGCPTDITTTNDPGVCGAIVSWVDPMVSDNCTLSLVSSNHYSGELFPLGTTPVIYIAVDAANNTNICTFNVTVIDVEPPVITNGPPDGFVALMGSCATNVPGLTNLLIAGDLCSLVTVTQFPPTSANLVLGPNIITLTAIDAAGNTASTNVTVTLTANPPLPATDTGWFYTDVPVTLGAVKMLFNDTNVDGRAWSVTSVSATSTNGFNVTFDGTNAVYTPTGGYTNTDAFTYVVTDCGGLSATGMVVLLNRPFQGYSGYNMVSVTDGTNLVYQGIPGFTYRILRTTNITEPEWTELGTVQADMRGRIQFTDTNPPPTQGFYRTKYP